LFVWYDFALYIGKFQIIYPNKKVF